MKKIKYLIIISFAANAASASELQEKSPIINKQLFAEILQIKKDNASNTPSHAQLLKQKELIINAFKKLFNLLNIQDLNVLLATCYLIHNNIYEMENITWEMITDFEQLHADIIKILTKMDIEKIYYLYMQYVPDKENSDSKNKGDINE